MKKDNKLLDFETATSSTIKAIASKKFGEREINFVGSSSSYNNREIKLSKISSEIDRKSILKTRGESDQIAIKLKYHNPKIHSTLKPNSDLASQIFNIAEEVRIETVGGNKFSGVKENINSLIKQKFETNIISPPGNNDQTSFVNALHLHLRQSLSGSNLLIIQYKQCSYGTLG